MPTTLATVTGSNVTYSGNSAANDAGTATNNDDIYGAIAFSNADPIAEDDGLIPQPSFAAPVTNPFGLADVGQRSNPTLVDIDGDGDLDAFVGQGFGDTIYFENTGSASSPSFGAAQTNPFGLADVGRRSTPTFADIDGDGDLDAFVGEQYSGDTFFFENTGSASSPSFGAAQTNPFGLDDVSYDSSPTFADIDGDGDLDAFVGELYGNTVFFENSPVLGTDPAFTTDEDTAFTTGNVLANDSDPDGDTVTFLGSDFSSTLGFVNSNGDGTFEYDPNGQFEFLGDGETATDTLTYTVSDGNGGTDTATVTITVTGINDAPVALDDGLFEAPQTNPFGFDNEAYASSPTFVDIDGDGDLDAFVGAQDGNILSFQNIGSVNSPSFAAPVTNPFGLSDVGFRSSPAFTDIDGDGDFDAFVGDLFGSISFFENIGSASNPIFDAPLTNPFGISSIGFAVSPTFADIDADGDLDLFSGDLFGNIVFLENTGVGFAATQTNPFGLTAVDGYTTPTFADLDEDGDLDAFVGSASGDTFFFENIGDASSPNFAAPLTNVLGLSNVRGSSHPTFADIDGDGDLDGFIGNLLGDLTFFENNSTAFTTDEDTAFTTGNVLANDSDPEGDTLTITEINGNAAIVGNQITLTSGALLTLNSDGTFDYDPNGQFESLAVGETATDTFDYTISDGNGGTDTATVTVTINGVNDGPDAVDDSAVTDEDNAVVVPIADLLVNDSDPDTSDTLGIISLDTTSTTGIANLDMYGGTVTYDPNGQFEFLAVGETTTDTFDYTISDGNGGTDTATVTVTINGVNDGPDAVDDSAVTDEDTPISGDVLINDSDPDTTDTLSVSEVNGNAADVGTQIDFVGESNQNVIEPCYKQQKLASQDLTV